MISLRWLAGFAGMVLFAIGTLHAGPDPDAFRQESLKLLRERKDAEFTARLDETMGNLLGKGAAAREKLVGAYKQSLNAENNFRFEVDPNKAPEGITPAEIENVRLALRLFQVLLDEPDAVIPTAVYLRTLGAAFQNLVRGDDADAITRKVGAAIAAPEGLRLHQLLILPNGSSLEGIVVMPDSFGVDWPLLESDPRTAGRLIARLRNTITSEGPGMLFMHPCYVEKHIKKLSKERGIVPTVQFIAGVAEECPAFAWGSDWSRCMGYPVAKAWRTQLDRVMADETAKGHTDIEEIHRACFITSTAKLRDDERTIAACGLQMVLPEYMQRFKEGEGFSFDVSYKGMEVARTNAEKKGHERWQHFAALREVVKPYPEFQVAVERVYLGWLNGVQKPQGKDLELPPIVVEFATGPKHPVSLRFQIVEDLMMFEEPHFQQIAATALTLLVKDYLEQGGNPRNPWITNHLYQIRANRHGEEWKKARADISRLLAGPLLANTLQPKRNDPVFLKQVLSTAIAAGDRGSAILIMEAGLETLRGDIGTLRGLVDGNEIELALVLCDDLPIVLAPCDEYFTPQIERNLPELLRRINDPIVRYRIELALSSLRDQETDELKSCRGIRLARLAEEFRPLDFPERPRQLQCLVQLTVEPLSAWVIRQELAKEMKDRSIEGLHNNSGSIWDGMNRYDAMSLETAYLGNLMREGKTPEMMAKLEPLLNDADRFDHGHWFLGKCLANFFEQVTWLLADGHPDQAAASIDLSRRIYHEMCRSGNGYNDRSAAQLFMDLCHAAGGRFGELDDWAAAQIPALREDYESRRNNLGKKKVGSPTIFKRLSGFPETRGRWGGPHSRELRIAAVLTLLNDPAVMKTEALPGFISSSVGWVPGKRTVGVRRLADAFELLDRWRKGHPGSSVLDREEISLIKVFRDDEKGKLTPDDLAVLSLRQAECHLLMGQKEEARAILGTADLNCDEALKTKIGAMLEAL